MVTSTPSHRVTLRVHVRDEAVGVLTNLHLHRSVGDSIQAWATCMEQSFNDIHYGDQTTLQDAIVKMHGIMARAGADVDGDTGVALSYLLAWRALVDGLIQWEESGSSKPLHPMFALPMTTVQREGNEGLHLLLSERNSHLQMIRDLQSELANRPHGGKYLIALIKETVAKYWSRIRKG